MLDMDPTEVEESDLQILVDNEVLEGKQLEFKKMKDPRSEGDKLDVLAELVSFANASGGDLLLGIDEDEDGHAGEVCGMKVDNVDGRKNDWAQIIRSGVEQPLPSNLVDIGAVELANDRTVFVIRVERSWRSPHRVRENKKFYGRSASGKEELDVEEIRRQVLELETTAEQLREFRAERILDIQARETPVHLQDGPVLALHVVPFSAFTPGERINVQSVSMNRFAPQLFGKSAPATTGRFVVDGYVGCSTNPTEKQGEYTKTFRSGAIETVTTYPFYPSDGKYRPRMSNSELRGSLSNVLSNYSQFLLRQDVRPPYTVLLTIIDAEEYTIGGEGTISQYRFGDSVVQLPEVLIETAESNPPSIKDDPPNTIPSDTDPGEPYASAVDEVMDMLWNAVGQDGEPGR